MKLLETLEVKVWILWLLIIHERERRMESHSTHVLLEIGTWYKWFHQRLSPSSPPFCVWSRVSLLSFSRYLTPVDSRYISSVAAAIASTPSVWYLREVEGVKKMFSVSFGLMPIKNSFGERESWIGVFSHSHRISLFVLTLYYNTGSNIFVI